MGKMLLSLSLTLVSNFDFDSECLVVNINIQNQDWQISFSKSKLNIQDYALGCQYQDSNSRFKSCISRLVLNFNICKFAWQYSIPKSKSLQTSNSTSISRILSISTSKSTNINQSCPPLFELQVVYSWLLMWKILDWSRQTYAKCKFFLQLQRQLPLSDYTTATTNGKSYWSKVSIFPRDLWWNSDLFVDFSANFPLSWKAFGKITLVHFSDLSSP